VWWSAVAAALVAAALVGVPAPAGAAVRNVAGTCPPVVRAPFPDVPASHVHAAGVACLAGHRVTGGRADGTFGPSASVTLGQMATFLRNTLSVAGAPVPTVARPAGTHAANFADLLAVEVIPPSFANRNTDNPISRAEMAVWMSRAYVHRWGTYVPAQPGMPAAYPFTDIPRDAGYRHHVRRLWAAGVVTGVAEDRFEPASAVSRGQMASFLARLLDAVLDGQGAQAAQGGSTFDRLSPDARVALVESAAVTGGRLVRWDSQIRLWADAGFATAAVAQAAAFWNGLLGDLGVEIVVVSSPDRANVTFWNTDGPVAGSETGCGLEGPDFGGIEDHVIVRGIGHYWLGSSRCAGWTQGTMAWAAVAHGLGHVLGLLSHMPGGGDLMSGHDVAGQASPALIEAMRYLYTVPPGSRPGA
jgi:hypothetical protein